MSTKSKAGSKNSEEFDFHAEQAALEKDEEEQAGASSSSSSENGVSIELLPIERGLAKWVKAAEEAEGNGDWEAREAAVLEIIERHEFVKVSRTEVPSAALPAGITGTQVRGMLNINRLRSWLRGKTGSKYADVAKGVSDDGLYTISALCRNYVPRGYHHFTFEDTQSGKKQVVVVRGFRKFTGFNAGDEDEQSGAADAHDSFFFGSNTKDDAVTFAVTKKSNGENAKMAVHRVFDHLIWFAGSKNTAMAWVNGVDPVEVYPEVDKAVPGPRIVHWVHRHLNSVLTQDQILELANVGADNRYTWMFEHNSATHEHLFPIDEDFAEFVAVLDAYGVPIDQEAAFALFDTYKLPRVPCDLYPIDQLDERMEEVRGATDNEGAVIYFQNADQEVIGLFKVKTAFYVIARRTRQILWSGIVDRMRAGKIRGSPFKRGKNVKGSDMSTLTEALEKAHTRCNKGMKELRWVDGCDEHHQEWAEQAKRFVSWWVDHYRSLGDNAQEQKDWCEQAKEKFGTLYASFMSSSSSSASSSSA